ncbi:hypothetical protein [Microvirga roseola]|uniref:hypothetical protein n=1 Tax=Microvirga roseola TaxID=2883126 RepID=UPI001E5226DC|nr:hypothetical protein [Microvirga roseola]
MRSLLTGLLIGAFSASLASSGVRAESAETTRVATMPFADCLSIIAEVSQEIDEEPVNLASTDDLISVRINASDGFVTVSCSRPDSRMTLTRSPVPQAAGITASR